MRRERGPVEWRAGPGGTPGGVCSAPIREAGGGRIRGIRRAGGGAGPAPRDVPIGPLTPGTGASERSCSGAGGDLGGRGSEDRGTLSTLLPGTPSWRNLVSLA